MNDQNTAEQLLAGNLSAQTRVNIANMATENTLSGVGAYITDHIGMSGTGSQAINSLNQTSQVLEKVNALNQTNSASEIDNPNPKTILKTIPNANANANEQAPNAPSSNPVAEGATTEQEKAQDALNSQINNSLEQQKNATANLIAAKESAADTVSNAAIATVAIGSMIATGGADTPLVIALAIGGGVIKVGSDAVIEGNNFDSSATNIATQAGIGALQAASTAIGPAQIASMLGISESGADEAAALSIRAMANYGLSSSLKDGADEIVKDGANSLVDTALATGQDKLARDAADSIAEKAIANTAQGADREKAVAMLSWQLQHNVNKIAAVRLPRALMTQALNFSSGATAGALSGAAQGAANWDRSKSVTQNLDMIGESAGVGAVTGGTFTLGTSALLVGVKDAAKLFSNGLPAATKNSALVSEMLKAPSADSTGDSYRFVLAVEPPNPEALDINGAMDPNVDTGHVIAYLSKNDQITHVMSNGPVKDLGPGSTMMDYVKFSAGLLKGTGHFPIKGQVLAHDFPINQGSYLTMIDMFKENELNPENYSLYRACPLAPTKALNKLGQPIGPALGPVRFMAGDTQVLRYQFRTPLATLQKLQELPGGVHEVSAEDLEAANKPAS